MTYHVKYHLMMIPPLLTLAAPLFHAHPFDCPDVSTSHHRHHHSYSLLLQSHRRWYGNAPPHDETLYDALGVRPNATLAEISRSYRKLSREFHPDKVAWTRRRRRRRTSDPSKEESPLSEGGKDVAIHHSEEVDEDDERDDEEFCRRRLAEIQRAYEILGDDASRLLYHRFGIRDGPDAAVRLLTGEMMGDFDFGGGLGFSGATATTATKTDVQCRLLELMGYPPGGYGYPLSHSLDGYHHHQHHSHHHNHHRNHSNHRHGHHGHHHSGHHHRNPTRQEHRIAYLASTIAERLRPLVEGTVSQQLFVEELHRECRRIKQSAMGAQILRCVGRAYRVEGYRVLRTMDWETRRKTKELRQLRGDVGIRDGGGIGIGIHLRSRPHDVANLYRDGWRDAKHFGEAAVAAGKWIMSERRAKRWEERCDRSNAETARKMGSDPDHTLHDIIGALPGEELLDSEDSDRDADDFSMDIDAVDSEDSDFFPTDVDGTDGRHDRIENEWHRIQTKKAHDAILSAHQMEALWKITKIELDRTIRTACRWILAPTKNSNSAVDDCDGYLEEDYHNHHHTQYESDAWFAFCPSEQSPYYEDWRHYPREFESLSAFSRPHQRRYRSTQQNSRHGHKPPRGHREHATRAPDGWIGTNGQAIPMDVGRLRAAAAMVLVGDVMVRCSKESNASWE